MKSNFLQDYFKIFVKPVLLAVITMPALHSCSGSNKHLLTQLHREFTPLDTLKTGYRILNLDSLTNFAWDRVYYFSGDTKQEAISRTIGFYWNGPEVHHTDRRLLFVRQTEVVSYVDCSRALVRGSDEPFLPISMYECPGNIQLGIPRKQAKFAIFRSCEGAFVNYEMAPLICLSHFQASIVKGCKDFAAPKFYKKQMADSVRRDFLQWNARK